MVDTVKSFSGLVGLLGERFDRTVQEIFYTVAPAVAPPLVPLGNKPASNKAVLDRRAGVRFPGDSGAFLATLPSLHGYMVAPDVERRCLFAVALHTKETDVEEFRSAFLYADVDGDGRISGRDLHAALASVDGLSAVDHYSFFRAADLDGSGMLTFREFVAACLHCRLAPLDSWLAEQAFLALDYDGDAFLKGDDVRLVFGELPAGLPAKRAFGIEEWCACLVRLGGNPSLVGTPRGDLQCCGGNDEFSVFFRTCCTRKISTTGRGGATPRAGRDELSGQDWGVIWGDQPTASRPAAKASSRAATEERCSSPVRSSVFFSEPSRHAFNSMLNLNPRGNS
jgi:hypothetical protein